MDGVALWLSFLAFILAVSAAPAATIEWSTADLCRAAAYTYFLLDDIPQDASIEAPDQAYVRDSLGRGYHCQVFKQEILLSHVSPQKHFRVLSEPLYFGQDGAFLHISDGLANYSFRLVRGQIKLLD